MKNIKIYRNAHTFFLIIIFLIFSENVIAQFQSVQIGINGLTCSQCSRSVDMSIRKLPFVKEVRMDLQNTEAEITFKEGTIVDVKKIAQAVVDAGFSVRYLSAVFYFKPVSVSENYCWIYETNNYQFVKTNNKELNGLIKITFIGKPFMPREEYKKWDAVIGSAKDKGCEATHVYYVTM